MLGHSVDLEMTDEELRVLGSLIEKERATPDQYPLSTNALRTACNQKSSRDPVVDYSDAVVERTMLSLRDKGHARTVRGGGRTDKHKQTFDEALGLTGAEVSVLGVLMLRGPQTPNELRTRTERLHGFESAAAVEATLNTLAAGDRPLVRCIGRQAGQRDDRWIHLLSGPGGDDQPAGEASGSSSVRTAPSDNAAPSDLTPQPAPPPPTPPPPSPPPPAPSPPRAEVLADPTGSMATPDDGRVAELESEVAELRQELDTLRARFEDLCTQLGVSP